jgi:hypothetical protein
MQFVMVRIIHTDYVSTIGFTLIVIVFLKLCPISLPGSVKVIPFAQLVAPAFNVYPMFVYSCGSSTFNVTLPAPNQLKTPPIFWYHLGANSCCSLMLSKNSFFVLPSVLNTPFNTVVCVRLECAIMPRFSQQPCTAWI